MCFLRRSHLGALPDGRIVVTGHSGSSQDDESAVVKVYSKSGAEIWSDVFRVNGAASTRAFDVATHSSGAIVVVGSVDIQGSGSDVWIRRYAG